MPPTHGFSKRGSRPLLSPNGSLHTTAPVPPWVTEQQLQTRPPRPAQHVRKNQPRGEVDRKPPVSLEGGQRGPPGSAAQGPHCLSWEKSLDF